MDDVMDVKPSSFKCRKCRMQLFDSRMITNAHGQNIIPIDNDEGIERDSCASDDGTIWFLKEDRLPNWLRKFVEESAWIKGKILCPKCGFRLGSFDFVSGTQCGCKRAVLPAVHVKKGKVDRSHVDHPRVQDFRKEEAPSLPLMKHAGRDLHQEEEEEEEVSSSTVESAIKVVSSPSSSSERDCTTPSQDGKSNQKSCIDEEITKTKTGSDRQNVQQPTEDLICPVCLEIYFEATACVPCGHIFCEPCLRNLGKRKPTATACPLCRQLILQCLPQAGLRKMVSVKYPHTYNDRKRFEQKVPTSNFPLPWQPGYHFRRQSSEPLMQEPNYSLQNLLFSSIPATDNSSGESGTLTFSASSLIVVISLMTVFMITLLAGYLCIRYFVVGILDMSVEETRYVVFVIFHVFVAFVIRWYFRYQVRSSIADTNH